MERLSLLFMAAVVGNLFFIALTLKKVSNRLEIERGRGDGGAEQPR